MPIIDHASHLITCQLGYYGPGKAGKTTNMSYLYSALPDKQVGSFTSLSTRRDRTLFFDYVPVELRTAGEYRVRFRLYTVPGPSHNRALPQLVLQGADGIAFVADSRRECPEENPESPHDLHLNFAELSVAARSLPFVFQYNEQDLPTDENLGVEELSAEHAA